VPNAPDITSQLRRELDDTRLRLAEAEETLNAIRNGEVDGLVVAGVAGQQVFTLQGAQEPYRLLIEQMSEGALTLSRDGVILYANQPFAKMLQMPPGRIIGVALRDLIDPADHPALADLLEAALSRHTSEDVSARTADGTVILLRLGVSRLQLGEESLLCAVATDSTLQRKREADIRHLSENLEARITERTTDLTASRLAILSMMEEEVESRHAAETANRNLTQEIADRKRFEEQLRASELRYRRLFEAARDGVLILDAKTGQVVDVNPFMLELLSYSREEFLGKKVWELGFFKDLVANEANFEELRAKDYIHYDNMALETSDGRRIETEFFSHVYLVNDEKVIQCHIRDITEYKKQVALAQKDALELHNKNIELERFLYAASHDLKSPVVTIRSFLGYLRQDMATGDAGRITNALNYIRTATDKMAQVLEALLEVARIGRVVGESVNVTFLELANTAIEMVAGQIAQRGVTIQVDDHAVTLCGDRLRLDEIWQNLVDNACKFMGDQKEPRIEIGAETSDAETVFFVRDNGIGIDPRHQAKVFGLFEKLDPKAEGTGVGLALVKRIVELYAGRIWLKSKGAGQGTCFYFTLPEAVGSQKTTGGETS
jgi:PAS domain S-box-containing protein